MKQVNKTVKHCSVCQENFGDRFSFCPVCGEPLTAVATGQNEAFAAAGTTRENAAPRAEAAAAIPIVNENAAQQFVKPPVIEHTNGASAHQEVPPQKILENGFTAPRAAAPVKTEAPAQTNGDGFAAPDGLYHLTILEAPKNYGRYLGYGAVFALFVLLTAGITLVILDIYNYNLLVEAPEDSIMLSSVTVGEPDAIVEPDPVPVKKDKEGGGGGGGGRSDPKPASAGAEAPQQKDPPIITPSVKLDRVTNPEIRIRAATQGPVETKRVEDQPYGIKNGATDPSDGPGRGLGQGNGTGTGQGNGRGTGIGNGNGSGRGNGDGNGIGNGRGDGLGEPPPPAPPRPPAVVAVTEKLVIISKPRANYTEEARKNQTSGKVVLKVTFSASGQVTTVSALGGLPYGLTDQAIAAARQIKFTPEKRGGQAVSVSKTIEYNFNLY